MNVMALRAPLLRRALHLEYATVDWNVVEAIVAVGAARLRSSASTAERTGSLGCRSFSSLATSSSTRSKRSGRRKCWKQAGWADPAAALAMTPLFVRKGRESSRGKDCCD